MKRRLLILIALISFNQVLFAAEEPKTKDDEQLAKIIIIPFEDKTGTTNFKYMTNSLVDAIDDSMKVNFEYVRISENDVNTQLKELGHDTITLKTAKKMAKKLGADVIIYGNFTYHENSEVIGINLNMFMALNKKNRPLEEIQNKVDSTLFNATKIAAGKIVDEIFAMVKSEQEQRAKAGAKEEALKSAKGKLVLTKNVLLSKVAWDSRKIDYNMQLTFFPGGGINGGTGFSFDHYLRYAPSKYFYGGVTIGTFLLRKVVQAGYPNYQGGALIGINKSYKRLNFYAEGFGGYALAYIKGPYYGSNVGLNFLLIPRRFFPLYAGLVTNYVNYKNAGVSGMGGGVSLGLIF